MAPATTKSWSHVKKNKSKPMNEGNYQIYQPGPIGKGDSELGNPSIFRGENAVRFQGVYRKKNKKKGGNIQKSGSLPS